MYYRKFYNLNLQPCTPVEFVKCWNTRYSPEGDVIYYASLYSDKAKLSLKTALNDSDVEKLLIWKFGGHAWRKFYEPTLSILNELNKFRSLNKITTRKEESLWQKTRSVSRKGIVAQAFLFHISRPHGYPIIDQHALRAYLFVTTGILIKGNPLANTSCDTYGKFLSILRPYEAFFSYLMRNSGCSSDPKAVDRALWTFGRFLSKEGTGSRAAGYEIGETVAVATRVNMPAGTVLKGQIIDLGNWDVGGWRRRDFHVWKDIATGYPRVGDIIVLIDSEGDRYQSVFTKPGHRGYVCLGKPSNLKLWHLKHYPHHKVVEDGVLFEFTGRDNEFRIYTSKEWHMKTAHRED